jgi:hypothetical protein
MGERPVVRTPSTRRRVLLGAAAIVALIGIVAGFSGRNGSADRAAAVLPVPGPGEATPQRLADGTPVWVVHHLDGAVSVPLDRDSHTVFGIGKPLRWVPACRAFVEERFGTVFDEWGNTVSGPAPTGLSAFAATASRDAGTVAVGGPIGPAGTSREAPTCTGPAANAIYDHPSVGATVDPSDAVTIDQAMEKQTSRVVLVRDVALHLRRGMPTVACGISESPVPGRCDGPTVPEVDGDAWIRTHAQGPGSDDAWLVVEGSFLARIDGDTMRELTVVGDWTWRCPTSWPADLEASGWCDP